MRLLHLIIAIALLGRAAALEDGRPAPNIRACVQFIEMPHTAMTELLSGKAQSGEALHDKAMAMTREGKAKLLENAMVTGKPNRTTAESFGEYIYQTEYVGGSFQLPSSINQHDPYPLRVPRPVLALPMQFETRNTGISLELVGESGSEDPLANPSHDESRAPSNVTGMVLLIEIARLDKLRTYTSYTDQWGDSSIRMPIFETWRLRHHLGSNLGKFELAGTITPKPTEPVPATLRKILVFVRCEQVPVGSR